jgi:hypothetical protein
MAFRMTWPRRSTVPCIDRNPPRRTDAGPASAPPWLARWPWLLVLLCAGCSHPPAPGTSAPGVAPAARAPANPQNTAARPQPGPGAAATGSAAQRPHRPARDWDEYRVHAAERIVAANQKSSYRGVVPEPLLAIPVLEIELNGDGSVRRIDVKRQPSQARDTVQLAIDAVKRAAPFPPVTHLPRPWKFTEVFLFDDERRFKPRSLDL